MATSPHDFREAEAGGPAVPTLGIVGPGALREAAAGSYQQIMGLITVVLRGVYAQGGDWDPWPFVKALFPDSVVIERDGKCWRYPYSYDQASNAVTLGQPVEVLEIFSPVANPAMMEARRDNQEVARGGAFIEAVAAKGVKPGSRYRIRAIRAGLSGNGNYYPDAVLREAVPLFEGARVFVKGDAEHLAGQGRDFRNLIGGLSQAAFVEGTSVDSGEVRANFDLLNPDGPEGTKLREAWERGMTGLFGFSIDAKGKVEAATIGGRGVRKATKFTEVNSVDLIVAPGAGGEVIGLVEAKRNQIMDRNAIIQLLEARGRLAGKKVDELTDAQLEDLLREAVAPTMAPAGVTAEQFAEALRMVEARTYSRMTIAASGLPAKAKEKLTTRFAELATFKEADVDKAIADEKSYVGSLTESGRVTGLGGYPRIEPGEDRAAKVADMLDAFFDPAHKNHRQAGSFKECYVAITGDRRISGNPDECDQALMRESLGATSWANVLGNSITRRMIADYNRPDRYGLWRQICNVVRVGDFRSNERTRIGGYGDLPIVTEGAAYLAQASPGDEKATYSVAKRGGTEDITLEMIRNDDVGAIQQVPMRFSRAAKRTLSKFVFDFLRTNPTVYDALAFFHATHNNLFATALDATQIGIHRLAMLKQTELTSADRIGIAPAMLVVPLDLEETSYNLWRLNTNNDKTFIQALTLTIIPVWYWTDVNDWHTMADPGDIPTIEIGFLDGNEEPELFVQDMPNVGSMFANDKLTYKLRHVYGGNVLDFRGATKAVV